MFARIVVDPALVQTIFGWNRGRQGSPPMSEPPTQHWAPSGWLVGIVVRTQARAWKWQGLGRIHKRWKCSWCWRGAASWSVLNTELPTFVC